MTKDRPSTYPGFEERLRFETLIADLSSKFVNLAAGEVDREIMSAQRRIGELLGLDLSALWQWSSGAPAALRAREARLAAGTDLAGLGYYEVDYDQRTCFLDDRFRDIGGIPAELQRGLEPVQFWMEHIHPDDHQLVSHEREKLHGGKVDRISAEFRYLHPANGQRWLHQSASSPPAVLYQGLVARLCRFGLGSPCDDN